MIFLKDKKLFICNPWLQNCAEKPKEVKGRHSLKMVGYFFFFFFFNLLCEVCTWSAATDALPYWKTLFPYLRVSSQALCGSIDSLTITVERQHKNPQMYRVLYYTASASSNLTLNLLDA